MRRVYFIKPIGMDGPIKIGCSVSPDNRRNTLETWSPFPLEIIAEIDGDFGLERQFHALFADSYVKHEWFRWSPGLADVVARINAGTFDVAELPEAIKVSVFRKARDNSCYTPEWRYEASVKARWRLHFSTWLYWDDELKQIVGPEREFLAHKDAIEALFERRMAERRSAAA